MRKVKPSDSKSTDSGLKADFILANPPFNMSDRGGENLRQDVLKVRPISDHGNVNEIIGTFGGADQRGNSGRALKMLAVESTCM